MSVPASITQLLVELVVPVPGSPAQTTQLASELLNIQPAPNQARATLVACELIIITTRRIGCPANFPVD